MKLINNLFKIISLLLIRNDLKRSVCMLIFIDIFLMNFLKMKMISQIQTTISINIRQQNRKQKSWHKVYLNYFLNLQCGMES